MNRLNEILQELGISKVKLAKYLGVSRQMVYNYLTLDSVDKWPKEKRVLLFQLLDIKNGDNEYLIPVIDDVVKRVDIESGEIYITPLKGIFDDENWYINTFSRNVYAP